MSTLSRIRLGLMGEDLWTAAEVGAYLQISPHTVSGYRYEGSMPAAVAQALQRPNRPYLYRPSEIRAWAARPRGKRGKLRRMVPACEEDEL